MPDDQQNQELNSKLPIDYTIEKATKEDTKQILEFLLSDFLHTEPLNVALDIKEEDAKDFFEEIIKASLAAPLSYLVRRNDTREIIGIRLASIVHRPEIATKETENFSFESKSQKTWKMKPTQLLLHHLEDKIWSLVPKEVHTLLSWLVLSVHSKYTRRGIARQLIEYNWDEARTFGCQGFITEATAFNSQQLFKRNGYQRIYMIELDKWVDEYGEIVFKCKDNTTLATLEYLPLPKP